MNRENQENSIYIIDQHHRVLYFNERIKSLFPKLRCGDTCYEVMAREREPCASCPIAREKGCGFMFYNPLLGAWTEVSTAPMEWPGAGPCHAMFVREIHTQNMNLFYGLTGSRAYDELFELNLTENTYKILFHVENKYVIPSEMGQLHSVSRNVAEYMIHPDDRAAFLEFWDFKSLVGRLTAKNSNNMLKAQFRKLRVDGGYCWVSQIVVLVCNSKHDGQIVMCFIQDINEQKRREQELQNRSMDVDGLTGLYCRSGFFSHAEAFLKNALPGKYCLMALDIEHFKLFNEWYGQKAGDCFLARVGDGLKQARMESGGVAGYMGGDDFGIVLPNDRPILDRLQNRIMEYAKEYGNNAGFRPVFGIYPIDNPRIPVSGMYDRAVIALGMIKGDYSVRSSWYDSEMKLKMEENHKLLSEVQRALKNREFTFYAQPKCNMATGKIIGLESLVRWNHPVKGIVPPGSFIPLLEENGLISNLDLYIWEEVCSSVRKWIDRGFRAVPISVNVSRVDIYTLDVVKTFRDLADKYNLPPILIEVEITESAYTEDYTRITAAAEGLRNAGFTVLMDDFGSGFSSLNMLKDVKVDALKIDMKFLEMDEQSSDKGMNILETVIKMARLMGLKVIAEGVETGEQVDFLLDMGCYYAQGYYFYRPMPIHVFESLLSIEENVDYRGIQAKQMGRLHVKELLGEDAISQTLLNNILGAVAFYEVSKDRVELVRVNEQYYRVTGTNPVDLEEHRKRIMDSVYQEDREKVMDIFRRARENLQSGAQGDFRRALGNGFVRWIHMRAFFLREQDGHRLYYGSISDVTEQKRREHQLEASRKALSAMAHRPEHDAQSNAAFKHQKEQQLMAGKKLESILRLADINCWDWDFEHRTLTLSNVRGSGELAEAYEMVRQKEFTVSSFPEGGGLLQHIREDYREMFTGCMESILSGSSHTYSSCEIPLVGENGSEFWIRVAGETINGPDGTPVRAVGYYIDITRQKREQRQRRGDLKTLELLRSQSVADLRVNLTDDIIVSAQNREGWLDNSGWMGNSYSETLEEMNRSRVVPEFGPVFREFSDRRRQLELFGQGICTDSLDYQRQWGQQARWMRMVIHLNLEEDGQKVYSYMFVMDIDRQKRREQELTRLAETDPLTGLYNRKTAEQRIREYLADGEAGVMIMFDLDNFKAVNDVFGHTYGDRIIVENAQKLKRLFRGEDVVCRLGGDEFLVFCKNIPEAAVRRKLEQILMEASAAHQKSGRLIRFSISAGYAMAPDQGTVFEDLYQKADVALFSAKMSGKGTFKKYDLSMKPVRYELAKEAGACAPPDLDLTDPALNRRP